MSQNHLAEFEEIVLLTVAVLDGQGYGANIINEIEERLERKVSLGAMRTVLKRLENKSLVKSKFGKATNVRGGKRKRLYEISNSGREILHRTQAQRNTLWEAIPNVIPKIS